MASIIAGLLTAVVSGYFLVIWKTELAVFLKGILPVSFFLAGLIAIVAGISSLVSKTGGKIDYSSKTNNEKQ